MDQRPLGFLLAAVGQQAMSAFRARLEPLGIHPRAYAVLWAVSEGSDPSQRDLSRALGLPASRMVGLLDDLQGDGLIERVPDPGDRRTHRVRLTDHGRRTVDRLQAEASALDDLVIADLIEDDRDRLRELLTRVSARLDREGFAPSRLW
ncbi:MAG TPA: MarR family winged helix-turn-helix transcriptional regulator [Microlunatus sp.]